MNRNEIIEKIKKLHELGSREMEYEIVLKKCPEKAEDINKWLTDIRGSINDLKVVLTDELREAYRFDTVGRYLIRITTTGSTGGRPDGWALQLFHVTGIYLIRKGSPWHEDVRFNVLCENFCIMTDKDKNVDYVKYIRQTDEFDNCPGYLDSNCFYNISPETLNGWKETTIEDYKKIYNTCMSAALSHDNIDLLKFEDTQFDIVLHSQIENISK